MDAGEEYTRHMGQYPVISISMKSAKQPNFEMAKESLIDEMIREYDRHRYLLNDDGLTEDMRDRYLAVLKGEAEDITFTKSIAFLAG